MAPWLRVLEAYLVQALLRTPAFHRGVEKVAKSVHRIRHGLPPEEMGGTKIDRPGNEGFFRHFSEEIQAQLGRAEAGDPALKSPEVAGKYGRSGRPNSTAMEAEEGENADGERRATSCRGQERGLSRKRVAIAVCAPSSSYSGRYIHHNEASK